MQTLGVGRILRFSVYAAPIVIAAAVGILYFIGGSTNPAVHSGLVQVAGSETMRSVVSACAEDFMTRNPHADIVVRGGGSGDGIAALLHGIVDIGMASRELSVRERDYAASRGIELSVAALALDGVVVVVHRGSAVAALELSQIRAIFAGKVGNWRQLEGPDMAIQMFARAAGSGTASLFDERVMDRESYAASVQHLPTNEAIVAAVAKQPGAIGYTGLGALRSGGNQVQSIALRSDAQATSVMATTETIRSGQYPLARALLFVGAGHLTGTAKAFLDHCLSAGGQALFKRAGYVGIAAAGP
jgi:phosphate transport system substrate-binding protein